MTTTVKVHVGGNYRAAVKQNDDPVVEVGPEEEKFFYVYHAPSGKNKSTFVIEEEYLGEVVKDG